MTPHPTDDPLREALDTIRHIVADAQEERDRFGCIAATIRVNARHAGASREEAEAMVRGEKPFIDWLVKQYEAKRTTALASAPQPAPYLETGIRDANGEMICLGDRVLYRLEGEHTKPAFWNPEYEVVWKPPAFTLKHVGGGMDSGSHHFKLKFGGGNGVLTIIDKSGRSPQPALAAAPQPTHECPVCGETVSWNNSGSPTAENARRITDGT